MLAPENAAGRRPRWSIRWPTLRQSPWTFVAAAASNNRRIAERIGRILTISDAYSPRQVHRLWNALQAACEQLERTAAGDQALPQAANWILDNAYLVDNHVRELLKGLSARQYARLPGDAGAVPRIEQRMRDFLHAHDAQLELHQLSAELSTRRDGKALCLAELRLTPHIIAHRLLRTIAQTARRILLKLAAEASADELADGVLHAERLDTRLAGRIAEFLSATPDHDAFVARFVYRLRHSAGAAPDALNALTEQVTRHAQAPDELIERDRADNAHQENLMRHAFTSLRQLSTFDWTLFIEGISEVDEMLFARSDVARYDAGTRDRYRQAIEEMARYAAMDELGVAAKLLDLTQTRTERDPGYWLIGPGRLQLEAIVRYRAPPPQRLLRAIHRRIGSIYALTVTLTTGAIVALLVADSAANGVRAGALVWLTLLALVPASELALTAMSRVLLAAFTPRRLARLDLSVLGPEHRTLVAIPCLLGSNAEIVKLAEQLEAHYLANRDDGVVFALLSDWPDSSTSQARDDAYQLDCARGAILQLNQRYGALPDGQPRFHLFHRARRFNDREALWMGWERKRGKLHELNRLLRGDSATSFTLDDVTPPASIKYVLTLDADTRLPIGALKELVGAAAHPLNRARIDVDARTGKPRLRGGYTIFQPRVTPALPRGPEHSAFRTIVGGAAGLDPYSIVVADLYQDLFARGSFVGKGLYDVDAFERLVAPNIPENTVLSHDLLEGELGGTAFIGDVEVFDEFPAHAEVAAARAHRWARGDWQLIDWIVGSRAGLLRKLSRWKLFDNLRRSLVPVALLGLTISAAAIDSAPWTTWLAFVMLSCCFAPLLGVIEALSYRSENVWHQHLLTVGQTIERAVIESLVNFAFLAQQAWLMGDAICRSLYRVLISRRHLLQWTTAAQAKASAGVRLPTFHWTLASGAITLLAGTAIVVVANGAQLFYLLPLLLLWWSTPMLAQLMSVPRRADRVGASPASRRLFAEIGRRTWAYFEQFVDASNHDLPPDNFQEDPAPIVAQRTSPTNIGLYLVVLIVARERGWIGLNELIRRAGRTLDTIDRLEHFRGHLLNWYDTATLAPLAPRYVSSVDSGNFAGDLLAFAQYCETTVAAPLPGARRAVGLDDTAAIIEQTLLHDDRSATLAPALIDQIRMLCARLSAAPATDDQLLWRQWLLDFEQMALPLREQVGQAGADELKYWLDATERQCRSLAEDFDALEPAADTEPAAPRPSAASSGAGAALHALAGRARDAALAMDFRFLYDTGRALFSIGWRVDSSELDGSYYDLLASEARLASVIAIAKGDVPIKHWAKLGRPTAWRHGETVLLSWSGSMFEYLMPELLLDSPPLSAIGRTADLIIGEQIDYAAARGVPWGISESAFHARDRAMNYQYKNFGVPGLGLKRGLGAELVIAPYASALAAMVRPQQAAQNMTRLREIGALGRYGFYEAIDFTSERRPATDQYVVVRCYMAHHQGMTIGALFNALTDHRLRELFHREPMIRPAELLLEERPPRYAPPAQRQVSQRVLDYDALARPAQNRRVTAANPSAPFAHTLGQRRYSVLLTSTGAGASRTDQFGLTRNRINSTDESSGLFVYLRDLASDRVWSAGFQPTLVEPEQYGVECSDEVFAINRIDHDIATQMRVVVSPDEPMELRQIKLKNTAASARIIELTSYAEVVLGDERADYAHPAFAKLFIQTEYDSAAQALLAQRRARSDDERSQWLVHAFDRTLPMVQFETDRAAFIGRAQSLRRPAALQRIAPLHNTQGAVLDPIVALRTLIQLAPGEEQHLTLVLGAAPNRDAALALVQRARNSGAFERTLAAAWTHSRVLLRHLDIEPAQASLYQELASQCLLPSPVVSAGKAPLRRRQLPRSSLWRWSISGDSPLLLVFISDTADHGFAWQILRAQEYWRGKQIVIDVAFVNDRASSYRQDLQELLDALVRIGQLTATPPGSHTVGALVAIRGDLLQPAERQFLLDMATVTLQAREGSLGEQIRRLRQPGAPRAPWVAAARAGTSIVPERARLRYWNGFGGFSDDGKEYVIRHSEQTPTPAPWVNVIANEQFGSIISASGSGFSWAHNSREFQLTPWSNDPVTEATAEACYLRDDDRHVIWSAGLLPTPVTGVQYTTTHGAGFTRIDATCEAIDSSLTQFVDPHEPVKFIQLRLTNRSTQWRRLSVSFYAHWRLGPPVLRAGSSVICDWDTESQALLAHNPDHPQLRDQCAFMALREPAVWNSDRADFIGRNGTPDQPQALRRDTFQAPAGAARLDPCAALQTRLVLAPRASTEVIAYLGCGAGRMAVRALLGRLRASSAQTILTQNAELWDRRLGAIQISTPAPALDLLFNRWLPYQTISSRLWARAGFYQAGGAYGFRDQLQDVMNIGMLEPRLLREQLLRCAAQQFEPGDVQHWWHPPAGDGVRTRCSDDRLWLPLAIARYLDLTDEQALLDVELPFLEPVELNDDEAERYFAPARTNHGASLYEHGARAIDCSLALGAHGLPLIGSGDWNDGLNRVGAAGRGESVWMAWFLVTVIGAYAPIARRRGESERADRWTEHARGLARAAEQHGWDGDWYRRAFFDDGTPLGSKDSVCARIDSLAQSWAVISAAADPQRARHALHAVDRHLVRTEDRLVLLLDPPFDGGGPDPGYIRGYIPGVRENGGQYTQAGVWHAMAWALLGEPARTVELLELMNPILLSADPSGVQRYRTEPYVLAADVYGHAPHTGRGGWSWYTGAAGWMYRTILEALLGVRITANRLFIKPQLAPAWPGYTVRLNLTRARVVIDVQRGTSVEARLDGVPIDSLEAGIAVPNDEMEHRIDIRIA